MCVSVVKENPLPQDQVEPPNGNYGSICNPPLSEAGKELLRKVREKHQL